MNVQHPAWMNDGRENNAVIGTPGSGKGPTARRGRGPLKCLPVHYNPESQSQPRWHALRLAQYEIDDPAAAGVGELRVAAVAQDVRILAARILQGIGQDRQPVEGPLVV